MYATYGLRRTEPCILPLCTAMTTSQFIFGSCVLERYALYNINALKICSNSDKPNTHYDGNQRCYKFFPSFFSGTRKFLPWVLEVVSFRRAGEQEML